MASTTIEYAKDGTAGVTKRIKKEGEGSKPSMGDLLLVEVLGKTDADEVVVHFRNKEVRLGKRGMWGTGGDLSLLSMRVGEHAVFTCEGDFAGPTENHPRVHLDLKLAANYGNGIGFTPSEWKIMTFFGILGAFIFFGFLYKEGFFG